MEGQLAHIGAGLAAIGQAQQPSVLVTLQQLPSRRAT